MSISKSFVSSGSHGYSLGSIIPEKYRNSGIKDYHPPININPNSYNMKSRIIKVRGIEKLEFYDFDNDWSKSDLFAQMKFIEIQGNDSSLELEAGTEFNGFILSKCIMTVFGSGKNRMIQETLYWNYQGDEFNTIWFWQPN